MYLKSLEITGFKSFEKKNSFKFNSSISAIVGPNGSGKSNIAEAFRFALGEQSIKSMRGKRGEDLIFNGSASSNRANRASVKVAFDNKNRLFDVDFDEVVLERVVHRDGINQYYINGSQVRLRDVLLILAGANIGSSGHHIISQGEADRILSAHARERREMIEDALGLRGYQYKKNESEKKLTKTQENIKQVESLRKEITPHICFLKKQVDKIEKTHALRKELKTRYLEYFKREELYLKECKKTLEEKKEKPLKELKELEHKLSAAKKIIEKSEASDEKSKEIINLEEEITKLRLEHEGVTRELGRIEGEISSEDRRIESEREILKESENQTVKLSDVKRIIDIVHVHIDEGYKREKPLDIKNSLSTIRDLLKEFIGSIDKRMFPPDIDDSGLKKLKQKRSMISKTLEDIALNNNNTNKKYAKLKEEIEQSNNEERTAERAMFVIMTKEIQLRMKVDSIEREESDLSREKKKFERELEDGVHIVGREILQFDKHSIHKKDGKELFEEKREVQEERIRAIEKIKIRIEESSGGSGEEIIKEHEDLEERDVFLKNEISDLNKSIISLRELIQDLDKQLNTQFKEGLEKINREFQKFFSLMFGGGTAGLTLSKEKRKNTHDLIAFDKSELEDIGEDEDEIEEGIDIKVDLPHKRIKGLIMLSGGERALTSIALLFAMSQVNPPPFLILDETDAALDEANSKRYGDMIESLSKHSQLILITHNRETMKRAGILYGVTMGSDGASKLLSVKFDEAVAVVK